MYRHTQKGPWSVVLFLVGAVFLAVSWVMPVPALTITFLVTGAFMFLLGISIGHLTVEDEGDQLAVRFGPFPLFRKRIRYEDIIEVERDKTTLLEGWGIHWSLRGGQVWNVWGWDCVVIRMKKGILRVGTDDAEGLVNFLKSRIASP